MGTIPTRAAFVPGAVLTATQLNELNAVDAFWARTPRCSAYNSGSQSLANNTLVPLTFDAEIFDNVQAGDSPSHDLVSNTSRLHIRTAGIYEFAGQVQFAANATGTRQAQIRLNAAGVGTGGTLLATNTQAPLTGVSTSVFAGNEYAFAAGDYIEIFGVQSSGGALGTVAGIGVTYLRMKLTSA